MPMPIDIGMMPGSRLPRYVPSTPAPRRITRPRTASPIPMSAMKCTGIRRAIGCDTPAPTMMPSVNGRNASPASNGE